MLAYPIDVYCARRPVTATPDAHTGARRARQSMRLLVTGGTGVLGRAFAPRARAAGHEVLAPRSEELDLFDPVAVAHATRGVDVVLHLATRIRPLEQLGNPEAWRDNDRLRADASRILVDAALAAAIAATAILPSALGATLHVADAARALVAALALPSGIYNVCRDGERVSNRRFTQAAGWHPRFTLEQPAPADE